MPRPYGPCYNDADCGPEIRIPAGGRLRGGGFEGPKCCRWRRLLPCAQRSEPCKPARITLPATLRALRATRKASYHDAFCLVSKAICLASDTPSLAHNPACLARNLLFPARNVPSLARNHFCLVSNATSPAHKAFCVAHKARNIIFYNTLTKYNHPRPGFGPIRRRLGVKKAIAGADWGTRSVLDCGGLTPLSIGGTCPADHSADQSAHSHIKLRTAVLKQDYDERTASRDGYTDCTES